MRYSNRNDSAEHKERECIVHGRCNINTEPFSLREITIFGLEILTRCPEKQHS